MGEVDPEILANPINSTKQFYEGEYWNEVHFSGHLVYTVFCLTVPMLILNILTAFAIKVCLIQLSATVMLFSCLRMWRRSSSMPRSTNWRRRRITSLSWSRASYQSNRSPDGLCITSTLSIITCRFIDLNIDAVIAVRPGVYAESNQKFDKRLISKWQEIFFNSSSRFAMMKY